MDRNSGAPEYLNKALMDWVFPNEKCGDTAFRCAVPGLFGPHPTQPGFMLMHWLTRMRGHEPNGEPKYCAFRERKDALRPLATLMTFYRVAVLFSDPKVIAFNVFVEKHLKCEPKQPLRLVFPNALGDGKQPLEIYFLSDDADEYEKILSNSRPQSRTQIAILVPSNITVHARSRVWVETGAGRKQLLRRYYLPAEAIFQLKIGAGGEGSLDQILAAQKNPRQERAKQRLRPLAPKGER